MSTLLLSSLFLRLIQKSSLATIRPMEPSCTYPSAHRHQPLFIICCVLLCSDPTPMDRREASCTSPLLTGLSCSRPPQSAATAAHTDNISSGITWAAIQPKAARQNKTKQFQPLSCSYACVSLHSQLLSCSVITSYLSRLHEQRTNKREITSEKFQLFVTWSSLHQMLLTADAAFAE